MSGPSPEPAPPSASSPAFHRGDLFASLVVSGIYVAVLAVLVFTTVL